MNDLKVLRETLRLTATIPIISVKALKDEILGGKYAVGEDESISLLVAKSQVDPAVFGETAQEFQPERMLEDNFNRLNKEFPNSWKPFGNGMRACIGRPFAWQEAVMVMAMLLQNFNFNFHTSITARRNEDDISQRFKAARIACSSEAITYLHLVRGRNRYHPVKKYGAQ